LSVCSSVQLLVSAKEMNVITVYKMKSSSKGAGIL
jgi:hypothetical protein